ncbi:hypothetical protein K474DRAFT_1685549 [Panus rudis PR-1116 ss-1]|nr:hypothetical protein K474DRAFT_1685549 [Panus rudis PR-1116 ss-1]
MGGGKPFKKIQGKVYVIDGDELVTEDDPKGDTKIDKDGNLLGGRRFKAQTFALPNRHPTRQYMLAIDAARTSGFRDSLYYFRRNPLAMKLNATQAEKDYLIAEGKLGGHLKTRSVTLITARSAYKLHGAKMVVDGRWVVDDYYEDKVLAEITEKGLKPGDPVGELENTTQANAALAAAAEAFTALETSGNRLGSGAATSMYKPGGPTTIFGGSGWGPYSDGPLNAVRKSLLNRDGLNEENWMYVAAVRTGESNREWARLRRENLKVFGGIYGDSHPGAQGGAGSGSGTQPPQQQSQQRPGLGQDDMDVDIVGVDDGTTAKKRAIANEKRPDTGASSNKKQRFLEGPYPMGIYEPHTAQVFYRSDTQPTSARWEYVEDERGKKPVLGGTKVGGGAWGLAWIDTVMELPVRPPEDPPIRQGPPPRDTPAQVGGS